MRIDDEGKFGLFFGWSYEDLQQQDTAEDWMQEQALVDGFIVAEKGSITRFIGSSLSTTRLRGLLVILIIAFSLLAVKLTGLQIVQGQSYLNLAEGNRQKMVPILSERGQIYDAGGIQLTKNIPNFSLALTPQDLPRSKDERSRVVTKLSIITGLTEDQLSELLDRYGNYSYESIILEEDIPYETALKLLTAAADLPGIHIHLGSKRLYLSGDAPNAESPIYSLSHVIGYLGKLKPGQLEDLYQQGYLPSDSIGLSGIEKSYESVLRGTYGKRRTEVDVRGKEQFLISEQPPTPGKHLQLSIDTRIQRKLEKILQDALDKNSLHRAAAVVADPRDGSIIAIVSLPGFDNNDFSGGISLDTYNSYISDPNNPLFNRAIGGTYPSGSTIKPAIAASALQEGIINQNTTFLSTGGIQVGDWFFPDWLAGGHGRTNVRKSLADSVNTFYYYIGGGYKDFQGLGVDMITSYLRRFGFAERLGIDIPGEQSGFLPSKIWKEEAKNERWYIGDTYNLAIGQGDILVTPLQIAMMTATMANGGTLYMPRVVQSIVDPTSGVAQRLEPTILREHIIDPAYVEIVRMGMRDCVTAGSCARLSLLPFSAAGKTGTAQWSSSKTPHAWFTSFAPYENPEIVVTILVEEGDGGASMSAPLAYEFYAWWWQYRSGLAS